MMPNPLACLHVINRLGPAYGVCVALLSHHHRPSLNRCSYCFMSPPTLTMSSKTARNAGQLRHARCGGTKYQRLIIRKRQDRPWVIIE